MIKKILSLLFLIIGICVAIILLFANGTKKQYNVEKHIIYVDEKIAKITHSKEYCNSTLLDKKDTIYTILSQIKKDKYILNFSYDKDNKMYSFIYLDGSLGGITLEKDKYKLGDIPIN